MRSRSPACTCSLIATAGGVPVCRTAFSYDTKGLLVGETNPRGGTSQIVRDAKGFPVSVTTADGVTTESEYDALGHLVAASRGGVELFRNTVDPDGRVTRTDYPDGTYETATYDAMRRPVETTDRAGRITTLSYSYGSTVTNTTVSYIGMDGMEHAHTESVRHDTQLNTREVRNAGRVAVEAYVLDAQDRVVAVTNAEGQVARMEYELGSRVSRMQRFDGSEVGYSWDAYGMKKAAYPSFANTYERLMDGSLLSATGPNGTVGYAYDKFGNVTEAATAPATPRSSRFSTRKCGR